jgi:hypothetical protein
MSPALEHRVISLRRGIRSLPGHSGRWQSPQQECCGETILTAHGGCFAILYQALRSTALGVSKTRVNALAEALRRVNEISA